MQLNDIKKILYRNPGIQAELLDVRKTGIIYESSFKEGDSDINIGYVVPFSDIGDAKFFPKMDAKSMIRYIDTFHVK